MTGIHTEQAMTEIANTVVSNIKNQLAEVDSSRKLETKALKITLNMAENAMKFVSMPFSGTHGPRPHRGHGAEEGTVRTPCCSHAPARPRAGWGRVWAPR